MVSITGKTASKGVATGRVVVVMDPRGLSQVLKGDVLVTRMTSPEFVPVFDRLAAVVTDLGGVTCHAAIVSREFKLPCIVGTMTATHTLKTGMSATVDASAYPVGTVTVEE